MSTELEPVSRQPSSSLRRMPDWLFRELRTDPTRAPEHIALAAAAIHGPASANWLRRKRGFYRHHPRMLAQMAKRQYSGYVRWTGAAAGLGGWMTMVPDIAAVVWVQTRMVLCIAAAYGHDPTDPQRAAELLVIQGLYPDVPSARAALDKSGGKSLAVAYVEKRKNQDRKLLSTLLKMAGEYGAKKLAVKGVPVLSIPINALGNDFATRRLAKHAIRYYESLPPGPGLDEPIEGHIVELPAGEPDAPER